MPLKKITEGPAAVDRSAPAQRPQTTIQWSITQPRYTMEDILLDETTRAQLLDVVSYFQNQELLFHQWGLAERFSSQSGLAVNLYGRRAQARPWPPTPSPVLWRSR